MSQATMPQTRPLNEILDLVVTLCRAVVGTAALWTSILRWLLRRPS